MEREELDYVLKAYHCLEGGTKEACIKVRDFLKCATPIGDTIFRVNTYVTTQEFIEAVSTLLAATFPEEDRIPKRWHCENDCSGVSSFLCSGECNLKSDAPDLCPYYSAEDK